MWEKIQSSDTNLKRTQTKVSRRPRNRVRVFDKSNPAHLYLNSLSENSAKTMERALDAIAKLFNCKYMDEFDWVELERHHVQGMLRLLESQDKSPATRALYLQAVKGVMREAWLAKFIDIDQFKRIEEIKRPRGSRSSSGGQALNLDDVAKAIRSCDDSSKAGVRDKAILALLFGAGLRRTECAEINLRDIDFQYDKITILGKGDKERMLPLDDAVMNCVLDWVYVRGEWDGPLFCGVRKGKRPTAGQLYGGEINQGKGLSDSSIYLVCRKRGIEVDFDELKPHNLRRTFGTEHDKAGVDLETISDLLGHANLNTTRTYIYDDKDEKKTRAMLKSQLGQRVFHST